MWDQYKRTLRSMQVVIAVVSMAVLLWSHSWALAALFFCVMQLASAVGGLWAGRLKRKFQVLSCQPHPDL
jgi:hypothetical protein